MRGWRPLGLVPAAVRCRCTCLGTWSGQCPSPELATDPLDVAAGFHSWLLVLYFSIESQGSCCSHLPITPVLKKKMHMLIMSLAGPSLGPDITCSMFTVSNTGCSLRLALGSAGSVPLNSLTYVSCFQLASALQESLHAHLALFLHARVLVRS